MTVECWKGEREGSQGVFKYSAEPGETPEQVWDQAVKELREEFPGCSVSFLGPVERNDVLILEVIKP